jgi:hypothetical protein
MDFSPSFDNEESRQKGGKIDVNVKLAQEVYGSGALSGEVDKFSSWGLKVRAFVGRFGAEEGGIERIPPEARTDQHPRDLFCFFSSGNCCITTLGRISTYHPSGMLNSLIILISTWCFGPNDLPLGMGRLCLRSHRRLYYWHTRTRIACHSRGKVWSSMYDRC